MKNKILYGIMAFVMGIFMTGCSDDDYSVNKNPLLDDSSVVTGSADVTATSATFHGTVKGLEEQAASAYATGFMYGDSETNLSEKASASSDAEFSATITGMPGQVVYYQAFVTLQGRVTYKGSVQQAVLTDAKAITGEVKDLTANSAVLQGSLQLAPSEAASGIVISGKEGQENVRAGVRIMASGINDNYEIKAEGLLPNTTYHYTAYLDLGNGTVYGEERSFTTPNAEFNPDEDLVDLGLSTKWAKYNVGATKATELGGLFGFGDMTGFQTSLDLDNYASADIYKTDRDVANKVYGSWVTMPTIDEFEELFTECKKEWVEEDGVAGYKFTGPNGNSIFLPAAGSRTQGTVSGEGLNGYYLSGSINVTDNKFAMAYSFDQNSNRRTTTPVYQALAIRPVSVAKNVKFDKSKLLGKTWEIDLKEDGSHYKFDGPSYFYGLDDSWATVTNNQPVVGDVWNWCPNFKDNTWVVGGDTKNCSGSMTFSEEDGKNVVKVHQIQSDGTYKDSEGTFTIDEKNKVLNLDIDILAPTNYSGEFVSDKKTNIKILSLDDESLQLGVVRTDPSQNPCLLTINYVTADVKYGFTAKLTCYGGDDENTPDAWNSATVNVLGGAKGLKTYTVTFNTQYPRTNGKVYLLELEGYSAAYPKALVRIDAIKADGNDVKFDANKFFYGDLEGKGNYRVEIANIWGCGHNDSWDGLKDTPFHKDGGETKNETALAFNHTFEVTFTVVSNTSDGTGVYTPTFNAVRGWGEGEAQLWGYNDGSTLKVVKSDKGQYSLENNQFDMTYEGSGFEGGTIMTFIEIADLYGFFPGTHATLDEFYLDGKAVSYDKSKVIDSNENPKYRLELFNCYAATKDNCAFGVKDGDLMRELGFNKSMRAKFTVHSLFAEPQW
jgi:osmotically-inducible protein OsmY